MLNLGRKYGARERETDADKIIVGNTANRNCDMLVVTCYVCPINKAHLEIQHSWAYPRA